jgi:hypothetical protein
MVVIENARLVERRIQALRERRAGLASPRGTKGAIPGWAADVLVQTGLTRAEIEAFDAEPEVAGEGDFDTDVRELDAAIDQLEAELLQRPIETFAGIQALAEVGVARLRRMTTTDPDDVFFDAGAARALELLDRVVSELRRYEHTELRRVG